MWGRILTKDNLKKRGWDGLQKYIFCAVDYLFFLCHVVRFVWNMIQCALNFPVQP
jgi:hypothetical protein